MEQPVSTQELIKLSEAVAGASGELKSIKARLDSLRRDETGAQNKLREALKAFEEANNRFLEAHDLERTRKMFTTKAG